MNNRIRQKTKWLLIAIRARPKCLGMIRENGHARVVFISPENVQDYRAVYGDKIEICE